MAVARGRSPVWLPSQRSHSQIHVQGKPQSSKDREVGSWDTDVLSRCLLQERAGGLHGGGGARQGLHHQEHLWSATGHIDPRLPPTMVHTGIPAAPLLEGLLAEDHEFCRSGFSWVADNCLRSDHHFISSLVIKDVITCLPISALKGYERP